MSGPERDPWEPAGPSLKERQGEASIASSQATTNRSNALTPADVESRVEDVLAKRQKRERLSKEEKAAEERAKEQVSAVRNDAELMLQAINRLRALVDDTTTGYGAAMSGWPASRATEVRALIKQIQSLKFFTQISEMKAQSAKGSTGIGRILQSEIPLFLGKWGELRQTRDAKFLLRSIDDVDNQARRIVAKSFGADIDNPDPKIAYQVRQQFGIREPGEYIETSLKPPPGLYASEGEYSPLKPGATEKAIPIPAPMQQEYQDYVTSNLGKLDPKAYAEFRIALDKKYGFGFNEETAKTYQEEADRLNQAVVRRTSLDLGIPPVNAPATAEEKAKADAMGSPILGRGISGAVGFTSGYTSDLFPSLVAGLSPTKSEEEIRRTARAYENEYPGASLTGRYLGGAAQAYSLPWLSTKYGGIPFMTVSGGVSGAANNPDDRLGGFTRDALLSGFLGLGLKGATTLARGAGDVLSPLAQRYNIPLTTGQLLESPFLRSFEQTLSKVPVLGSRLRARFEEGNVGFNQAAFDDALSDIGGSTSLAIGPMGIDDGLIDVSNAYDAALRGVRVPVTPGFRHQVDDAIEAAGQLDPEYTRLLRQQLDPLLSKVTLDGNDIQQILYRIRGVSATARDVNGSAWKNYVLPHIRTIEKATTDAVDAVSPDAAAGLRAANSSYRKMNILADSVNKHADEGGIFTPQTLLDDVKVNVDAYEGPTTLARAVNGKAHGKDLPLFNLAQTAANKKTGLMLPPEGVNIGLPLALTGLGAGEAGLEHFLSGKDEKGHSEDDFVTTALRNAAVIGGVALAPSLLYSSPTQRVLSSMLQRYPSLSRSDLFLKYLPYGATAATRIGDYNAPLDLETPGDIAIRQLPRMPSDLSKIMPLPSQWPVVSEDATEENPPQEEEQTQGYAHGGLAFKYRNY